MSETEKPGQQPEQGQQAPRALEDQREISQEMRDVFIRTVENSSQNNKITPERKKELLTKLENSKYMKDLDAFL